MSVNVQDQLKKAAQILKNSAPEEYAEFFGRFCDYTFEVVDGVSESDAANIMIVKGNAQQCKALCRIFDL